MPRIIGRIPGRTAESVEKRRRIAEARKVKLAKSTIPIVKPNMSFRARLRRDFEPRCIEKMERLGIIE